MSEWAKAHLLREAQVAAVALTMETIFDAGVKAERERLHEAIVTLDSAASWCRHRHAMPDDVKREVDAAIALVRAPAADHESGAP